ncbi:MAG: hypothetical protein IJZ40_05775, partial [Bacteroidaceae bacterium]|nr:hypothetical protein [Bacteroidaceae bacterium]
MMEYVYDDVIAKVGQKFYNEDMKFKYQENNDKLQKRDFCRGTREEYTRRWLFERLSYLDTRFEVGEEAQTTAVVRSNVVNELTLTIETYHPQWVRVKFMDGTVPVIKRLAANTPTVFRSSECPDIPNGIVDYTLNIESLNMGQELLDAGTLNLELYLADNKAYVLLQNF